MRISVSKINLKYTRLGSYVLTAKFSHHANDDDELLKFKDFQDPLTSNSKTFKVLFGFQGLSRSLKNGNFFSSTFKDLWPACLMLIVRGQKGHPASQNNFQKLAYADQPNLE